VSIISKKRTKAFLVLVMRKIYEWKLPQTNLSLGQRTAVMAILNVTPDSFSDGGQYPTSGDAIARGKELEQEGADIIDVGGESSRPGSVPISEEEEMRRVIPVIEGLVSTIHIPISVDTYRSRVAERAIKSGAQIVNDISAFRFDEKMASVVANTGAGVVLMHSRGSRDTLHQQSAMMDPVGEVRDGMADSAREGRSAGISAQSIVVDPGIGFGKAAQESIAVLKSLAAFSKIEYPLLVGTSRKSFIRKMTSDTPEARNWGTAATIVVSILNGAHIVRVHDVRQARVLADVTDRMM
jgi:dihydropteroate synthase